MFCKSFDKTHHTTNNRYDRKPVLRNNYYGPEIDNVKHKRCYCSVHKRTLKKVNIRNVDVRYIIRYNNQISPAGLRNNLYLPEYYKRIITLA